MSAARVNIRQAGPADVDARDGPDDPLHAGGPRLFLRLLVETWASPDFDDWVVVLAEVYDQSSGTDQVACYAAWDISYQKPARFSPEPAPQAAGTPDPAHAAEHSRACDEGHEMFLDTLFGTEQVHLQALGTHPLYLREGSGQGAV
ncbi:hypothetical protein VPNG_09696 [Cytospora leucostoma]|uniref:Uncharacterized protein n=1 Tax=Cytospora leucostoma TaxID=1230097 RepID=A0A423VJR8_9PEZI|nr:hypothetical protein VPNG_09696 [Cytospora leucostoma]